jgi:hypothetical protein
MKLSFLINLISLLLLIVGIYALFSNQVQGTFKMALIIFCLVMSYLLISKIPFLKGYNEIIKSPQSAKENNVYLIKDLKDDAGRIGLSVWFYINDWNYKFGKNKIIIKSSSGDGKRIPYFPEIKLDRYKNDVFITVPVQDSVGDAPSAKKILKTKDEEDAMNLYDTLTIDESFETSCKNGYVYLNMQVSTYNENVTNLEKIGFVPDVDYEDIVTDYNSDDIQNTGSEIIGGYTNLTCINSGPETVTVQNVNIQKWVNMIVTFNNRTLDVYMNGKLVKSTPFNNVILSPLKNDSTSDNDSISITPNGGFNGLVSKIEYYPYFITPSKAWSIYRGGFGDAFEGTLNQYNLKLAFYENSQQQAEYSLF